MMAIQWALASGSSGSWGKSMTNMGLTSAISSNIFFLLSQVVSATTAWERPKKGQVPSRIKP